MVMEDFTRKKKNDSVEASLKNVTEQRHLETRLKELEKLWHAQLKYLTKEKLELKKDLVNLYNEKANAQHFNQKLQGESLKTYIKDIRGKLAFEQNVERMKIKYDFDQKKQNDQHIARLPAIEKPISILQENGTNAVYSEVEKPKFYRYHSNLSLRKSISDPDLLRMQTQHLRGRSAIDKRESNVVFGSFPNISIATQIRSTPIVEIEESKFTPSPEMSKMTTMSGFVTGKCKTVYDQIRLDSRQGKRQMKTNFKPTVNIVQRDVVPRLVRTSYKKTRRTRSTDIPENTVTTDGTINKKYGKPPPLPPLMERCHTVH